MMNDEWLLAHSKFKIQSFKIVFFWKGWPTTNRCEANLNKLKFL